MKGVVNMIDEIKDLLERLIVLKEMETAIRYIELASESGVIKKDERAKLVEKVLDRYGEIFGFTIMNTKENFGE